MYRKICQTTKSQRKKMEFVSRVLVLKFHDLLVVQVFITVCPMKYVRSVFCIALFTLCSQCLWIQYNMYSHYNQVVFFILGSS